MSLFSDEALIESFLTRVEAECADLPKNVRQRLLSNLASHLRELDGAELADECEDPAGYARELREALNLASASTETEGSALLPPKQGFALKRWLLVILLVIVATAGGIAVGFALTDGTSSSRQQGRGDNSTHMPAPQVELPVPEVVGLSADAAQLQLLNAGLKATIRLGAGANPSTGTVIDQDPKVNVTVKAGTAVTIYVGPAK
jgi:hypothetical protein